MKTKCCRKCARFRGAGRRCHRRTRDGITFTTTACCDAERRCTFKVCPPCLKFK